MLRKVQIKIPNSMKQPIAEVENNFKKGIDSDYSK